jgi:hypothetical protein
MIAPGSPATRAAAPVAPSGLASTLRDRAAAQTGPGIPGKENALRKRVRKLALHRETLVDLDRQDLRILAGGVTRTCPRVCEFSNNGLHSCATCNNQTCTTNLC